MFSLGSRVNLRHERSRNHVCGYAGVGVRRWRGQVPTRLARELALRAAELPDPGRVRLLDALTRHTNREQL